MLGEAGTDGTNCQEGRPITNGRQPCNGLTASLASPGILSTPGRPVESLAALPRMIWTGLILFDKGQLVISGSPLIKILQTWHDEHSDQVVERVCKGKGRHTVKQRERLAAAP